MRNYRSVLIAVIVLAMAYMAPTQAFAQAGTGIKDTAHDFTQYNTGGALTPTNTQDVGLCTFCHTPHKALTTQLIWNHKLSTNTFTWVVDSTQGGSARNDIDTAWAGPTKYCLSCHDGTVAIGDINWFKKATPGAPINTKTVGADYQIATAGGSLAGNHPVAHPFPFGGAASTYNGSTSGSTAVTSGWQADPVANGIRLFVQSGTGIVAGDGLAGSTGIECSSCHDPHNGTNVQDDYFLRGTLTGNTASSTGYICLKCHAK